MNRIGVEKPSPLGTRDPGGPRRPRTRHPGTPSRGPRLSQGSRRRATKFRQPPGLALSGCQLLPYRVRTRLPRNPENQNATRSRSHIIISYFICSRISAHCAGWRGARPRVFPTPKTTGCVLLAITDDQHPPRNPRRQHGPSRVTGLSRPGEAESGSSAVEEATMPCIAGITLHGYTQSASRGRRDPRRAQRTTTSSTTLRAHRTAPT